jgi:nicotinamide phosphoribosyltransferase
MSAVNKIDFYKADHRSQYPQGTELVLSNLTARKSRLPEIKNTVFFGLQYFIKKYLIEDWDLSFFREDREIAVENYKQRIENALGKNVITYDHIAALHDLGYLPIKIMAVPEGSLVPIRVPSLVVFNTHKDFFWLTNYLETILSTVVWGPITSATTAFEYRKLLSKYAKETIGNDDFVQFQGHDFSYRGMFGHEAACMSGAGHLLSFVGTDTVPAIDFLEEYYRADSNNELIGCSVPASEHSVMSMGGENDEIGTFDRFLTDLYPQGIVSVVSDTWDFWKVITEYLPSLKDKIMAREGKLVIRPDSGDPADIICGTDRLFGKTPEEKGAIQCLWDTFGGTISEKGFKVLDSHIGLIYGDSITLARANDICERLKHKGFASTNVVLGIGSYTYQYVTRDTFGFAVKATYGEVNGHPRNIFKKPKTDSGMKNSAKGITAVFRDKNGELYLKDEATWDELNNCELKTVFCDGDLLINQSLSEIRTRLLANL